MITCYFEDSQKPVQLRHLVVDMLVIDKQKILLVKRGSVYLESNKWALPGGYLEKDETIKQAALRETLEETGYRTKVVRLFTINDNPHRPGEKNRQSVSLVFLLKPLKKVGRPDNHEIKETRWFDLANLPPAKEIAFDHYDVIQLYQKHLQKPFILPILK